MQQTLYLYYCQIQVLIFCLHVFDGLVEVVLLLTFLSLPCLGITVSMNTHELSTTGIQNLSASGREFLTTSRQLS